MSEPVRPVGAIAPTGIVAPNPAVIQNITAGQRIQVRPGEPVYLFIEKRTGFSKSIEGLNKRTPFVVTRLAKAPQGVTNIRTQGTWFRVEVPRAAKVGTTDRVHVRTLQGAAKHEVGPRTYFTFEAGPRRMY
jgi:hypothetical protein